MILYQNVHLMKNCHMPNCYCLIKLILTCFYFPLLYAWRPNNLITVILTWFNFQLNSVWRHNDLVKVILTGSCYSSFSFLFSVVLCVQYLSFVSFCFPWSCLFSDLMISVCPWFLRIPLTGFTFTTYIRQF